jgi:GNAT superfamily N-acetyltransferase
MATKIVTHPPGFYRDGMEDDVTVRPAGPGDAEALAALIRACFAELAVDPPPSALGETAASVACGIAEGGVAVAASAGGLAGGVLWAEKEDGLYVGRLCVAPGHRRTGLARRLLQSAEQEARRRGLPRVHLGTRLSLAGNRALFAACGFVERGRFSHPGFAEPTWVALEKFLS